MGASGGFLLCQHSLLLSFVRCKVLLFFSLLCRIFHPISLCEHAHIHIHTYVCIYKYVFASFVIHYFIFAFAFVFLLPLLPLLLLLVRCGNLRHTFTHTYTQMSRNTKQIHFICCFIHFFVYIICCMYVAWYILYAM